MKKFLSSYLAVIPASLLTAVFLLSACETLGMLAPKSFDQKWATAMSINTGIRAASTSALNSKAITVEDAKKILTMNDSARSFLDEAENLRKTDLNSAQAKLELADAVIRSIQKFLDSRGAKVGPVTAPPPKSSS
jgi:hypothetical protein